MDNYTIGAAENTFARSIHGLSDHWYPIIIGVFIFPVGMVKVIKYLIPFSMIANGCLMVGAGAVFYFIFIGSEGQEPLSIEKSAKLIVWPMTSWSLFAGSTLCSLEGIGMVRYCLTYTYYIFRLYYLNIIYMIIINRYLNIYFNLK